MFIYKFTNLINNKSYVGKWTSSIEYLYKRYKYEINSNSNRHIVNALRKYNFNNFKFEIIKESNNKEDLKLLEIHFISFFNTFKNGYNKTVGGDNGPGSRKGWKMSHEGKLKISLAKKGKPSWNKGIKASDKTRQKLRDAHLGKKRNISIDEKQKLRERIITYNKSNVAREKSRQTMCKLNKMKIGSHLSEEHKRKISESEKLTKSLGK